MGTRLSQNNPARRGYNLLKEKINEQCADMKLKFFMNSGSMPDNIEVLAENTAKAPIAKMRGLPACINLRHNS